MKNKLTIEKFRGIDDPILDVRSPVEFEKGHIPGAVNFPLFSNEERAEIGICYKENGREAAIELGFDLVGPRLGDMIRRALKITPEKAVRIHCWRGGMRSESVAWLLETAGFRTVVLEGGYKTYRHWARQVVAAPRMINIVGGLTGSGKTRILKALREQGEQMLDLEGLANHRGSSFGSLGKPPQPSTQYFENLVAEELVLQETERPVWIESESAQIGSCWVPEELFGQMKLAPVIEIVRPLEARLDILTDMYGDADRTGLIEATERIRKGLGGERTTEAIEHIRRDDIREACRIILDYYDRSYLVHLKKRPAEVPQLDVGDLPAPEAAKLLIKKTPILIDRNRVSEATG